MGTLYMLYYNINDWFYSNIGWRTECDISWSSIDIVVVEYLAVGVLTVCYYTTIVAAVLV